MGARPPAVGPPPSGLPAGAPGPGRGSAPPQAAGSSQDGYVTGRKSAPITSSPPHLFAHSDLPMVFGLFSV